MDIVFGFAEWVTVVCELGCVGLCVRITLRLHVGIGSYKFRGRVVWWLMVLYLYCTMLGLVVVGG